MLNAPGLKGLAIDQQEPRLPSDSSVLQKVFGVVIRTQTYARLLYLLLLFAVGTAVFVALVSLIATGGGLLITLIGLPILVLTVFGWCYAAEVQRLMANTLLGSTIRPLPFEGETGKLWTWTRIGPRLRNEYTWRALAFNFLSFPLGIATITIAWSTLGQAVVFMLMPLTFWIGEGPEVAWGWRIDTANEALWCFFIGAVAVIPSLHVVNLTGWLCRKVAVFFLQSPERDIAIAEPRFDRAVIATVAWQGYGSRPLDEHAERVRSVQLRVWQGHVALYLATMLVLVVINGLATPDTWWVLWPAWGWGMLLAAHTGYFFLGHLGAHAALYVVAVLGLFLIDAVYAEQSWFYWPMIGWGIALAAHAYVFFGFSKIRPEEALILFDGPEVAPLAVPEPVPVAPIAVDVAMRNVRVDGSAIEVTPKEFDLLALLTAHPGRPFSREELLDTIWKNDFEVTDRTIDTHVQRLRRKLGLRSEAIQTVWGVGYRYQP